VPWCSSPADLPRPRRGRLRQHCSADELLDAWLGIIRGFKRANRILADHVEKETGLAPPDFLVLTILLRSPDPAVPLSAFAKKLDFSSGGFTKLADRLQQVGMIERRIRRGPGFPSGRARSSRCGRCRPGRAISGIPSPSRLGVPVVIRSPGWRVVALSHPMIS
jgi:hypothetical protein